VKKSLVRAPLLVPFLCVAACTTQSGDANLPSVAAIAPAAETVQAEAKPPRRARTKMDQMAARPAMSEEAVQQSVRPDATIASVISEIFQRGRASWYGPGFDGRRTASGERFQSQAMTAAHPSLPFGTRVRVTHVSTGRSVVVRINDRGPFHGGRIIDLAAGPARMLGLTSVGSAYVSLHRID
jgi:rare lipoprotein A